MPDFISVFNTPGNAVLNSSDVNWSAAEVPASGCTGGIGAGTFPRWFIALNYTTCFVKIVGTTASIDLACPMDMYIDGNTTPTPYNNLPSGFLLQTAIFNCGILPSACDVDTSVDISCAPNVPLTLGTAVSPPGPSVTFPLSPLALCGLNTLAILVTKDVFTSSGRLTAVYDVTLAPIVAPYSGNQLAGYYGTYVRWSTTLNVVKISDTEVNVTDSAGQLGDFNHATDPFQFHYTILATGAISAVTAAIIGVRTGSLVRLTPPSPPVGYDPTIPPVTVGRSNSGNLFGGVILGSVIIANYSGLYVITPGKSNDTYYDRVNGGTEDFKIPDPFIKTGFIDG